MKIDHQDCKMGRRSRLDYTYQGKRHRPTLGYNLPPDMEQQAAVKAIQEIHDDLAQTRSTALTFVALVPMYEDRMVARKRQPGSIRRNKNILTRHLVPFFGPMRLPDIRLEHGDRYIIQRRTAGAADGTIGRECAVLSAILNYAVDAEYVDRNRLRRMAVPDGARRSRTASPKEIAAVTRISFDTLTRAMTVALHTGLREQLLVDVDEAWIEQLPDGPWLVLPKARSRHKNNPDRIPLNPLALQALLPSNLRRLHGGRIFANWKSGNQLGQIFRRKVRAAGIHDLHFHDLRHTFSTTLENLGIDTRLIDLLTGHKIHGMGETYRHGGAGRDTQLREAVTQLAEHWRREMAQTLAQATSTKTAGTESPLQQRGPIV